MLPPPPIPTFPPMALHSAEDSTAARWTVKFAEKAAGLASAYHRARLVGGRYIPEGPALLVGNHGRYGYETPVFFYLLMQRTGRAPIGLADRGFFRLPLFKTVLPWLGGIPGTRDHARQALHEGQLVVCYPGGAREVFKKKRTEYQLRWDHTHGFARVAALAQVPVLPFAGAGIDEIFPVSESLTVKLSDKDERYTAPIGVPVPMPVRLTFAIGRPLYPPPPDAPRGELVRFRERVASSVRRLLRRAADA